MSRERFSDLLDRLAVLHEEELGILRSRIAQLEVDRSADDLKANDCPSLVLSDLGTLQTTGSCHVNASWQGRKAVVRPWQSRSLVIHQPILPSTNGRGGTRVLGNITLDVTRTGQLMQVIDLVASVVIILNTVSIFADLEFRGRQIGIDQSLGNQSVWPEHKKFFRSLEHWFQAAFTVELAVRILLLHRAFFITMYRDGEWRLEGYNIFDCLVVALGAIDLYIIPYLDSNGSWFFARMIRIARVSRTFKLLRVIKVFSQLRVLVNTIVSSFMALFWPMILLFLLMAICACSLLQLIQSDLESSAELGLSEDTLKWMYAMYGTSFQSLWTIFEVTLGGQGSALVRNLVNVRWTYGLFFTFYISVVVFSVICIMEALFLKETLKMAARDADVMVQEKLDLKRETFNRIHDLFIAADASGDGLVSMEEFQELVSIPKVRGFLELLELEIEEVVALFNMLDPGDGNISYNDFVSGIFKLKGQARSLDMVAVMLDCRKLLNMCEEIQMQCEQQVAMLRRQLRKEHRSGFSKVVSIAAIDHLETDGGDTGVHSL